MMLFERGTRVQWQTIDGIIHTGVVQQIVKDQGHNILEDGATDAHFVPTGACVKVKKHARKKQ